MSMLRALALASLLVASTAGCEPTPPPPTDAGPGADAGAGVDAGVVEDAGAPPATEVPLPCASPGAVETVPCGRCGMAQRTCGADGRWAYGACEGETGECEPGDTEVAACGRCGQRTRFCQDTCAWMELGACLGEMGTCTPGDASWAATGCPVGQARMRTCSDACAIEYGPCVPSECTPGETSAEACGRCGTRARTCDETGHWLEGGCEGEGPCAPGDTRTTACGVCGMQAGVCDDACAWQAAGACEGEVTCGPRPSPTCVDASTLRTFGASACVAGACAHAPTDRTCLLGCSAGACTGGAPLLDGLGGPAGYGPNSVGPSDDGSSPSIDLAALAPTGLNYYGADYTTVFVNTNGSVSFGAATSAYASTLPGASVPLVAGLWGDVDTTGGGAPAHNDVTWSVDATRFVATWHLVGSYPRNNDRENSFQIVLTPRADRAAGDFDVEFRFAQCDWHSTPTGGPAAAGFDAGDGTRGLALPGSGTPAVLDLCALSNVGTVGVHRVEVRGGIPVSR